MSRTNDQCLMITVQSQTKLRAHFVTRDKAEYDQGLGSVCDGDQGQ